MTYQNPFDDEEIKKLLMSSELQPIKVTQEQKAAKLMVLLNQIETELLRIKNTITELKENVPKYPTNYHTKIIKELDARIEKLDTMLQKIRQARLNLNWHFL